MNFWAHRTVCKFSLLWKRKSSEYSDGNKREKIFFFLEMVNKYNQFHHQQTETQMWKNALRIVYDKEIKKWKIPWKLFNFF